MGDPLQLSVRARCEAFGPAQSHGKPPRPEEQHGISLASVRGIALRQYEIANREEVDMFRIASIIATVCVGVLAASAAQAQYPVRPIRFVVPFPPGGLADYVSRVIAQQLTQSVGQQVLVDNRGGGDGAVAGTIVANSAPDGYTIFFGTNSPLSAVPALHKRSPYDPVRDFTAVSMIGRFTFFLFSTPSVPAHTLTELIDYARANPGKLNYGTGNTSAIVASAQLKLLSSVDITHVPYKGDAAVTTDMLGGRVQLSFMTPVPGLAYVKEGRLRLLAGTAAAEKRACPRGADDRRSRPAGRFDHPVGGLVWPRENAGARRGTPVARVSSLSSRALIFGSNSHARVSRRKLLRPPSWIGTTESSSRRGAVS